VAEIYNANYAPNDLEINDTECNSSDDDIVNHITQQQRVKSSEFDVFLKVERAPALNNTLNWWKVSYCVIKIIVIIIFN
jgi:hypothetical protein